MGFLPVELKGRVAVVTGGNSGIGRGIAAGLASAGCSVVVAARNEAVSREAARELEGEYGVRTLVLALDVKDVASTHRMADEVVREFGRIDILVNNAGITRDNLIMRMSEEDFDRVLAVNLKGAFNLIKLVTRPMLRKKSGRIVNIASVVGICGNAGQANYAASKAGLIGLTKSAAKELAPRGVTVNAVAPGFIETDMTAVLSEDLKKEMQKSIPLARLGSGEDVANAVAFLCSDLAGYITGQVLHVDGGMLT